MSVGDDILAFSATREPWQQDLFRRIFTQSDLDDDDINELLSILKNRAGLGGAEQVTPPEPLSKNHIPYRPDDLAQTTLVSVRDLLNVNQIATGQCLPFAKLGITLIFGDNGSGKTGYTRVLKSVCRARHAEKIEPVLGNVYAESAAVPATATVTFVCGNSGPEPYHWQDGQSGPAILSRISVFDAATAPLYADRQGEIEFLPQGLDVLPRAAEVCELLADRLNIEIRSVKQRMSANLPAVPDGTRQASIIAQLTQASTLADLPSPDVIAAAATWSDQAANEFSAIANELALDPEIMGAKCRRIRSALEELANSMGIADGFLNDEAISALRSTLGHSASARAAANLAADAQFKDEPISTGIGSEPWRAMFYYAREFLQLARPGADFPGATPGEPCPLCQQPLDETAHTRLCHFHAFLEDEARRNVDRLEAILNERRNEIDKLQIPTPTTIQHVLAEFAELGDREKKLVTRIAADAQALISRRATVLEAISSKAEIRDINGRDPVLRNDMLTTIADLDTSANEYDRAMSDAARLDKLRNRKQELIAQKIFSEHEELLQTRRTDLERLRRLEACLRECDTRAISLKNSELRGKYITGRFKERMESELANFELDYVPIKIDERSDKGKSFIGPALDQLSSARASRVLSEGEFRGLALACFLSEIGGIDAHDGIIVDDPVSSLDSHHIRNVARRLVSEAETGRQVIIFTHDLTFYYEMWIAATDAAVPIARHWLRRTSRFGCGTVYADDGPWEAKNVKERLKALDEHLQEIRKLTEHDDDSYRRHVTDFYTGLRETWERLVEEVLLNSVARRFQPDVATQKLREVQVNDEDHQAIWTAMRRISERSGHDKARGRSIALPKPAEMEDEVAKLRSYLNEFNKRKELVRKRRQNLEKPPTGI